MNLFRWLFAKPRFERILDAYTFKRSDLWQQVSTAIEFQQSQGNSVWIISHFAQQFFEIQTKLGQWGISYQIVSQTLAPRDVVELSRQQPDTLFLAIAELLQGGDRGLIEAFGAESLALIAVERHPLIELDHELEQFARRIPCRVKFGYYLALDDPLFEGIVSPSMVSLLQNFGMQQGELVNSIATTRCIDRLLKKRALEYDRTVRADSAAQWLKKQPTS